MSEKIKKLISDKSKVKHYLVEFETIVPNTKEIKQEYFGTTGRMSKPGEFAEPTYHKPNVASPLTFTRSMFSGSVIGGASIPAFGSIVLYNNDGSLDYLRDRGVGLRPIKVKLGGTDFAYGDYQTQFSGVMENMKSPENRVVINIKDFQRVLEQELPIPKYEGKGGLSGNVELTGIRKPCLYGFCYHIEPVYLGVIDGLHTYQYHYGESAVYDDSMMVFDGGNPYTYTSGKPTGSEWTLDEKNSLIKVAQLPTKTLTANLKGDAKGGYVDSVANIILRVLKELTSITDIDLSTFEYLNGIQPAEVGVFRKDSATAIDLFDSLVNNIGGYWGFNRSAFFEVGRFDVIPENATSDVSLTPAEIIDIENVDYPDPIFELELGYAKRWVGSTSLVEAASQAVVDFMGREFRTKSEKDEDTKLIYPNSAPFKRNTNLIKESDADKEAKRLFALLSGFHQVFRVTARSIPALTDLGRLVNLKYPRFGLDKGKVARVIQITDLTDTDLHEVYVWV